MAEIENIPVGCVGMKFVDESLCRLERLAVAPAHRRIGIGRALVEHVLSEAKAEGMREVKVAVISEQTELMDWYEKLAFETVGTKMYSHLPFEVTWMSRKL